MSNAVSDGPPSGLRGRVDAFVHSPGAQRAITGVILLNAVTLGLETSGRAMAAAGDLLIALDRTILAIFVIEISAKLYARRLAFFRDRWNVFDFIIVGIGLAPATQELSVLRALRVLRVLRLVSMVPSMRKVVQALLSAIPGMASIMALLGLIYYVAAVIATKLFAASFPDWFGTIGASFYSLFQIMTLESWSMGIVRPVMEVYPQAWAFFVPFILMTTFAVLNLFVAIVVNAMQSEHDAERAAEVAEITAQGHDDTARMTAEIKALREEVRALRESLRPGG